MNSASDDIVAKIKKLLRMKKGCTTFETETALKLAHEIAIKYGLDIYKINPDEQSRCLIEHANIQDLKRVQIECKLAAMIINSFFNIRTLLSQRYESSVIIFIGTKSDIEIARYIYTFIIRSFRYQWNHNRGRLRNRNAFLQGMYLGLCSKLRAQMPRTDNPAALIYLSHNTALLKYKEEKFPETTEQRIVDRDASKAKSEGYLRGWKIEIRSGLNASEETLQLKN